MALLAGCSSAIERPGGLLSCSGFSMPLVFLVCGAPCVIGTLWDVTDKDCNALTDALLQHGLDATQLPTLQRDLVATRRALRQPIVNGAAFVIIGR
jgi:hypothetical protein